MLAGVALLVAAIGSATMVRAGSGDRVTSAPPNFVIILADDLGYGDLSCFGNQAFKTPHLDQMAAEGVRLNQFYVASPACSPSRVALLTGKYPLRAGIPRVLNPKSAIGLRSELVTLPELLKAAGYATHLVGKWHLGHLPQFLPTRHGFDTYFGIPYSNDMKPAPLMRDEKIVQQEVDQTTLTRTYTEEAQRILTSAAGSGKPFFLYLASNFPHVPLHVSERFKGASGANLYGDVVTELDWSVGEILRTLRATGLDKSTLVLFASDNGPWLIQGSKAGSAGPLRDGKGTQYEGGIRVPGIAWWPGGLRAKQVLDTPVIATDVLPTLCRLAGVSLPSGEKWDGQDVWPVLSGLSPGQPRTLFFPDYSGRDEVGAVRHGDWKLITEWRGAPGAKRASTATRTSNTAELYNLAEDPSERRNVATAHPDVVTSLTSLADQMRAELEASDPWQGKDKERGQRPVDYVTPGTDVYLGAR